MKKKDNLGSSLLVLLALVLLFIKSVVFYGQINLKLYHVPFAFATCGILLAVYLAVYLFSPKAARIVFFSLYIFGSFLMSVDSVYFAYASRLPSVVQLGMVGQLDDVSSTIKELITWKQLLPLMDFPLWFLFCVNCMGKLRSRLLPKLPVFLSGLGICGVCLFILLTSDGFRLSYITNEIYCYHAYDIVKALSGPNNDTGIDKSLYTVRADRDSEYFGIAENRNVIILQIEAMQNFVLGASYNGQVITPNLNELLGIDTLYFNNYYYQIGGGNTCDAEFAVNNSLFGPEAEAGYIKYADNDFNGLPWLLKQNGYSGAYAFHGYEGSFWNREYAYVKQGFDDFKSMEDYPGKDLFPLGVSDRELFTEAMENLKSYEEPFYSFFITVSSHHPYALPLKDRGITLLPEDDASLFGFYIQSMNYVDTVIGEFLEMMKEADLYDNSIFVLYGDHYALTNTDNRIAGQVKSMIGRTYTLFDVFNVPMMIHIPGLGKAETFEVAGGHIDVLPTLLCLLGLENTQTVMFGQNLLTAEKGIVCEQTHLSVGSFISDEIMFCKPSNGIEANYSIYEKGTMARLSPQDFMDISEYAEKQIRDCEALLIANDIFLNSASPH